MESQTGEIYRELELNLRIKPKKRLVRERPEPLTVLDAINRSGRWISCMTAWRMVARFDY
jgi:hypothetical protein